MKDTLSLLLATAILAAGGLGLYMYKSDETKKGGDHQKDDEDYNEDSLFGSGSFWGSSKNEDDEHVEEYDDYEEYKPKSRGGKTKRRRASGGTKRRY